MKQYIIQYYGFNIQGVECFKCKAFFLHPVEQLDYFMITLMLLITGRVIVPKSVGMNNDTPISIQRAQGGGNYRFVLYISLFTFSLVWYFFILN